MQGNGQIASDRLEEKKPGLDEVSYHKAHSPCLNTDIACQASYSKRGLLQKCPSQVMHYILVYIYIFFFPFPSGYYTLDTQSGLWRKTKQDQIN